MQEPRKQRKGFDFYKRFCVRCGNIFKTTGKFSTICPKCIIPCGRGKVKPIRSPQRAPRISPSPSNLIKGKK